MLFPPYFLQLMKAKNAPRNAKAYNLGLKAYSRLGHMGATLTAYKDMIVDHIEPDVEIYRILGEGSLQNGSAKVIRWTIYILWRLFIKEVPNTELINKFIECCVALQLLMIVITDHVNITGVLS